MWPKGARYEFCRGPSIDFLLTAILMRGLWEAWYRAPAGSQVANYLEAYLSVQVRFTCLIGLRYRFN